MSNSQLGFKQWLRYWAWGETSKCNQGCLEERLFGSEVRCVAEQVAPASCARALGCEKKPSGRFQRAEVTKDFGREPNPQALSLSLHWGTYTSPYRQCHSSEHRLHVTAFL